MNREKQNVALLLGCQALSATCVTVLFTVAALVGDRLVTDKSLTTLPLALFQVAVMLATIPISMLMQRRGRRFGFGVGTLVGMAGAGLGAIAIVQQSFLLFCGAMVLLGIFNGAVGFYRFAAADAASESFRAQAISLVVAGGVVAALVGPRLAIVSQDWLTDAVFAGCLLSIIGLQVLTLGLLAMVRFPGSGAEAATGEVRSAETGAGGAIAPPAMHLQADTGRAIAVIMKQPIFRVSVLGSMVGYGVMVLVMTATPLAVVAVPHPFHQAATVIQWHVLGMFAPSLVTGFLIARFGVVTIILCGVALNFLCVAINLAGMGMAHFLVALTLLGIGWNFMFVGSTTLLTESYRPAEKAKTQAAHDFLMSGFVVISTFLSGHLFNRYGWATVNLAVVPPLAIALGALLWLQRKRWSLKPAP